jgi:hypothetical protein
MNAQLIMFNKCGKDGRLTRTHSLLSAPVCTLTCSISSANFVATDTVTQIQREINATFQSHKRMLEAADAVVAALNVHLPGRGVDDTRRLIQKMDDARQTFEEQANNLYCNLDLHGGFPPLGAIALEYLQALLLAHHLKIMIRKKVFGHSIAISRIGSAKGGKQAPAG